MESSGVERSRAESIRVERSRAESNLQNPERRPSAELIFRLLVAVGRAVYGRAETRAAMATFVSELEAAKKNLSEALGDNVKQ